MNNKAYKNLIAFTFAFFVLATANNAFAAVTADSNFNSGYSNYNNMLMGNYGYGMSGYNQNNYNAPAPYYVQTPNYAQPAPVSQQPVAYIAQSSQAPVLQYVQSDVPTTYVNTTPASSTKSSSSTKSVSKVESTDSSVSNSSEVSSSNLGASAINSGNNLSALSMNGSNSFMPDTVFEWFITIIFILIIVIMLRVLFFRKKYDPGADH